jgi:prepilin-type processing-associated H-X9-DG protein
MKQQLSRVRWWEGLVLLGAALILFAVLFPVFAQARAYSGPTCLGQAKQQALALAIYAQDYDGSLPDSRWMAKLRPYTKTSPIFNCIERRRTQAYYGYALHSSRLGARLDTIAQPTTAVLTLETSRLGFNATDSGINFIGRHNGFGNMTFADGHAKSCLQKERKQ